MIIRQAEIQKFGKLEKEQYRFSPQINIIYGPNESGKSTLMQFLKAMMYGLETLGCAGVFCRFHVF